MKTKDLLSQLSRLELSLINFSVDELSVTEASKLKKSFEVFKNELEEKLFSPSHSLNAKKNSDLNYSEQAYTTANSAKDVNMLVAQVSHEIRTPLNGIIGFTDLLKEDELSKTQLERVNAIQSASYSLMEIINELLEFSKLSAGLEKFETVDFKLSRLVNDVLYLCETLLNNKNIKLEAHIDADIPEVLIGDPSKLTQILLNILGNAIKFVEHGTIKLGVYLKKKRNADYYVEFIIEDTGIGISEENLIHIFDSFKQAENDTYAQYGGTGLGLSIVKQIIDNLKGEISVASKIGIGTTFKFNLPYAKGAVENLIKAKSKVSREKAQAFVKEMHILVFEDNPLNQRLIEQRLKSWKCNVRVTDNVQYGLNILKNENIDVILMDLKMPKMSGYEVTEIVRKSANKRIRETPIIALTADFTINDEKKCVHYKINDFILKPYTPDELLNKLVNNTKTMHKTLSHTSQEINPENEIFSDATKINLAVILEDCMGNVEILEELVTLYKQNALEFIGVVSTNLPDGDMNLIADVAHKIKSGLAMMQSESLHSIVVQIQKAVGVEKDKKHLQFLFDCFVKEYPLVEIALEEQINALKNN